MNKLLELDIINYIADFLPYNYLQRLRLTSKYMKDIIYNKVTYACVLKYTPMVMFTNGYLTSGDYGRIVDNFITFPLWSVCVEVLRANKQVFFDTLVKLFKKRANYSNNSMYKITLAIDEINDEINVSTAFCWDFDN